MWLLVDQQRIKTGFCSWASSFWMCLSRGRAFILFFWLGSLEEWDVGGVFMVLWRADVAF